MTSRNSSTPGEFCPTANPLTIGVELEVLACIPKTAKYPANRTIYEALMQKANVPCPNPNCTEKQHLLYLPVRERPNPDSVFRYVDNAGYSGWQVTNDGSLSLDMETEKPLFPEDTHTVGNVELQSRKMYFYKPTPCPRGQLWPCNGKPVSFKWQDEIALIVNTLTQAFQKPEYRLLNNSSTGMHVHVGRDDLGIPFEQARNVTAMFVAFERILDTILPTNRICGYDGISLPLPGIPTTKDKKYDYPSTSNYKGINQCKTTWCKAMSTRQFEHTAYLLKNNYMTSKDDSPDKQKLMQNLNVPAWLNTIYQCDELPTLTNDHTSNHFTVVNLENLCENPMTGTVSKKTIEFRSHAGTLEMLEITSWINLVARITDYCSKDPSDMLDLLKSKWADPHFNLPDLIKLIGCSTETLAHYTNITSPESTYTSSRLHLSRRTYNQDSLTPLTTQISFTTRISSLPRSISQKQLHKLLSGRYGQFPISFLESTLSPTDFQAAVSQDSFLCIGSSDVEVWTLSCKQRIRKSVRKLERQNKRAWRLFRTRASLPCDVSSDEESGDDDEEVGVVVVEPVSRGRVAVRLVEIKV